MAVDQRQKDFKKFADNLKRTAVGVKFAKRLFTEPTSLSPRTITQVLQTLGADIPPDVLITAEVAQVIISGQAIATGYNALDTARSAKEVADATSDIKSATNATAAGIRTLTSLGERQGAIDADSASIIRIGVSVGMIIASCGADVASWISLATELASIGPTKQGLADYYAIINAQDVYKARMTPQTKILSETFKDYQEKKISIYGVIAKMAVETPDLWPQVINQNSPIVEAFPNLMMLPVVENFAVGRGTAEISGEWPWPVGGRYIIDRWESRREISFQTLGKSFNKETSAEYFFETLIRPWVACYSIANDEIVTRGNMSMSNIAALSYLVNPQGEISDTSDYVKFLLGSCLTPYDFGDEILKDISMQFLNDYYKGQDTSFKESAISFGLTDKNKVFSKYQTDNEIMRRKLELVKQSDDITELVQYPYIYKKLQSYMDFQKTSFERDPSYGGKLNQKFDSKNVRAWRKLHNYIAVIHMIDQFRTDSYLKNTRFAQQLLPFMPSVDSFTDKVERLNYLSTARSVNMLALNNIAGFIGTDPKKLKKINASEQGAAIYTIK